jgi:urease accessory protein
MKPVHAFGSSLITLLVLLAWPAIALAHVGIGSTAGFVPGLAHPISGLDHLCAMIGVGIWAAQRGDKAIWVLPLAFLLIMALGGAIGSAAVSIPFAERGVIVSVFVIGVLIATAKRMPLVLTTLIVATFAFVDGHVHGTEMPVSTSGLAYAAGFLATTAFLLLVGVVLELRGWKTTASPWTVRYSGVVIIALGLILLLQ